MANEGVKVVIGADVKGLEKGLKKASSDVQRFEKSVVGGSKGMQKLGKSTANAVPSLTSFSQVIQDAPYGIQGVANNITQLTSQFGYLSKASGGAGAALKGVVGAMTGPAGILLAVSAVTSLWVSYGDEIGRVLKGNSALEASQKAVASALQDFYGGSVATLQSYVSVLEDVNTDEETRINLTKELIKKVPTLTEADFKYGTNLDIVRSKIGDYVLAQASRIEADTLVEENSEKLAKKAKVTQIKSIKDEESRIKAFTKFLKDEGERVKKTSLTGSYISQGRNTDIDKTADEITADFIAFAAKLEKDLAPVQDRINELYGTTFSGGLGGGDDKKKTKKTTTVSPTAAIQRQTQEAITALTTAKSTIAPIADQLKNSLIITPDGEKYIESSLNQQEYLDSMRARLEDFNNAASNLIKGNITDTFAGLGQAIGEGLAGGGNALKTVGKQLLSSMGKFVGDFGKLLIAYGVANMTLFTAMTTGPNPISAGAAIAAGVALVAIGGAISSLATKGAKTGMGATGGTGSSDVGSNVGGSGRRETSYGSGGSSYSGGGGSGGTYVFEIAGTKLIGVLRNTLDRNSALGGNLSITG